MTGPQCFCPALDKYMYTKSDCTGSILKDALYGGVGAAIGVLVIIICTVLFLLYRSKTSNKDREAILNGGDQWFEEDKNDEWTNNIDIDDGNQEWQGASRRNFRPILENVNTQMEVKIKRPEIYPPLYYSSC
ncbi:mucin-17-like [Rana temporaria]|uniref:mucin-17-like n=1 Tax=Rana temporaria TaxID=8407 RepID=UPI001AACD912|nr:mucin-17-like [Rana temporaria]